MKFRFVTFSQGKKWFTLVELIIVISILAILATIAFMSYQWYTSQSRNSNRLTTVKNIESWLNIFYTKAGQYPTPDSSIQILAWTAIISEQGTVWNNVVRGIAMNQIPTDPVDNTQYVYTTPQNYSNYQLLLQLESSSFAYLPQTYAWDSIDLKQLKSIWGDVGILIQNDGRIPNTNIDISTGNTQYLISFPDEDVISTSWSNVFSQLFHKREDLLRKKSLAIYDPTLVAYWDMETTIPAWGYSTIKDFSKNALNAYCYEGGSPVNCWSSTWPQNSVSYKNTGKWLKFDGDNDWMLVSGTGIYSNDMSYFFKVTPYSKWEFYSLMLWYQDWSGRRPFNLWFTIASITTWWVGWFHYWSNAVDSTGIYDKAFAWHITYNYTVWVGEVNSLIVGYVRKWKTTSLYVNNKLIFSQDWDYWDYFKPNYITLGNSLNWDMDEVRIFNKALSVDEMNVLYNVTK